MRCMHIVELPQGEIKIMLPFPTDGWASENLHMNSYHMIHGVSFHLPVVPITITQSPMPYSSSGSPASQFVYLTELPSTHTNVVSTSLSLKPTKTSLFPNRLRTNSFSWALCIDTRFALSFLQVAEASE